MFANTLLNDDFTKEVDFDSLGLDNLQLNLGNPAPTTSTAIDSNTATDSLQASSQSGLSTQDLLNSCITNSTNSSDDLVIINNSNIINKSVDLIFQLQLNEESVSNKNNPHNVSNFIDETSNSSNVKSTDDEVFKKPSNEHIFSSAANKREPSNEQKQIINLFESIDLMSTKSMAQSPKDDNLKTM